MIDPARLKRETRLAWALNPLRVIRVREATSDEQADCEFDGARWVVVEDPAQGRSK